MVKIFKFVVDFLGKLLNILRSNFPIVLSLAVIYLVFGVADQGQDMLININRTSWGPLTLYLTLGVLSLIHWQSPKFFSAKGLGLPKFKNIFSTEFFSDQPPKTAERIVPRLFGVCTWLLAASCILRVMLKYNVQVKGVKTWYTYLPDPDWFLGISLVVFGWLLWKDAFLRFYNWLHAKNGGAYIFSGICIVLASSPVIFWPLNYGLPSNQLFLLIGFSAYAVLFALLTSTRWSIIRNTNMPLVRFLFNDKTITVAVWVLAFTCSAIFIFFVCCNAFSISFRGLYRFTLAILLCGFIFYLVMVILLQYRSKKSNKNYFAFVIVVMIILVSVNPAFYHNVKIYKKDAGTHAPDSLRAYMAGWIRARVDSLRADSNKNYPIILVNTYGGGIRAAAWTCVVVNALDRETAGSFQRHVFCYSGASGGTVGAAVLCANGFNDWFNGTSYTKRDSLYHDFFTRYDYLTGDLVGLLGNDALSSIIPYNRFNDRAEYQAASMEDAYKELFQEPLFGKDLFELWKGAAPKYNYMVPLLFSNSAEVTRGYKGILAPVMLDWKDFMGDELINKMIGADSGIKLSTAAFLSARFPYFSPAGQVRNRYFIDGGAKENSGAETNLAVRNLFAHVLADSFPEFKNSRFPFVCVSLKNTNIYDSLGESKKKVSQLWAPVSGVINGGISGATEKSDSINRGAFSPNYFLFCPQAKSMIWTGTNILGMTDSGLTRPVMPLGWQFSELAMAYMEKSIKDNNKPGLGENNIPNFIDSLNKLCSKK
jgi:hypothetical protein